LEESCECVASRRLTQCLCVQNIGPRELLNQCWQKENKTVIAPSITKLIVKFNEVGGSPS
jgi:hypothetical protein